MKQCVMKETRPKLDYYKDTTLFSACVGTHQGSSDVYAPVGVRLLAEE